MEVYICTWGTGGAFGRELGVIPSPERKKREQSAVSITGTEGGQNIFHFMVDAGAPCVEKMINNQVSRSPDLLFITHGHNDHVSDFDKLANSRMRGLMISKGKSTPLYVISSPLCAEDPVFGLKARFRYLEDLVKFLTVPYFDVWYTIRLEEGMIFPSSLMDENEGYPVEFKLLPVYHASHAPGACMYIFRIKENKKRIVVSGDFECIEDFWVDSPDLKDPDFLLIETNTIKAVGTNHTNWQQNMKLLNHWLSAQSKTRVLITHISGYEDWAQNYYTDIPTDRDWLAAVGQFKAPPGAIIEIAEDEKCYQMQDDENINCDKATECKHEKTRVEEMGVDVPCAYEGIEVCTKCGKVLGPVKTISCSECPDDGDVCYDRHRWYNR